MKSLITKRLHRVLPLLVALLLAGPARATPPELGVGIDLSTSASWPAVAYGLNVGLHGETWGGLFRAEHNAWLFTESQSFLVPGALDVAVGVERFWFDRRARSSLYLGASVLLYETPLDNAGSFGPYLEIRPLGIRHRVAGTPFVVQFDPLCLSVAVPAVGSLPFVMGQYRTTLTMEWVTGGEDTAAGTGIIPTTPLRHNTLTISPLTLLLPLNYMQFEYEHALHRQWTVFGGPGISLSRLQLGPFTGSMFTLGAQLGTRFFPLVIGQGAPEGLWVSAQAEANFSASSELGSSGSGSDAWVGSVLGYTWLLADDLFVVSVGLGPRLRVYPEPWVGFIARGSVGVAF